MIPWALRWRAWVWGKAWEYQKLWRDHPLVVVMAMAGVLLLLRLGF